MLTSLDRGGSTPKVEGPISPNKLAPARWSTRPASNQAAQDVGEVAGGSAQADDKRPAVEVSTERHIVAGETLKAIVSDPDLFRPRAIHSEQSSRNKPIRSNWPAASSYCLPSRRLQFLLLSEKQLSVAS